MIKKITKRQRNKIVAKLTSCYLSKPLARLSYLIYCGEVNFNDTFGKSFVPCDGDIDFIISSSEGCSDQLADLTKVERTIFDLLSLAR